MESCRNPLCELFEGRIFDHSAQFGLAHKDQLQKLVFVGVDVGEHPQLFQRFNRQVLRFVDDQHHIAALRVFVDDEILEALEHADVIVALPNRHIERVKHPANELTPPALRGGDQPDLDVLVQFGQQLLQQCGLARPDLAGDDGQRCMGGDPVFEERVGLHVRW